MWSSVWGVIKIGVNNLYSFNMLEELCWDAVGKRGGLTNYEGPM